MTERRLHLGNDCYIKELKGRCVKSTEFTGLALSKLHLHKIIAGLNGPLESHNLIKVEEK